MNNLLQSAIGNDYYYQDHQQRWKFYFGNEKSRQLLIQLLTRITPALNRLQNLPQPILQQGQVIYRQKPNKDSEGTWSQEEYSHLGLQLEYLRFKSFQRYTETYNALTRMENVLLRDFSHHNTSFTVASLGGGPGIELLAVHDYLRLHHPHLLSHLRLISLDLESSWKHVISDFSTLPTDFLPPSIEFFTWDCQTLDAADTLISLTGHINLGILSYVLHHHFQPPHCIPYLVNLLNSGQVDIILVNGRDEVLTEEMITLSHLPVHLLHLIPQHISINSQQLYRRDDRQFLLLPSSEPRQSGQQPTTVIYPNVPYEEHKQRRNRS